MRSPTSASRSWGTWLAVGMLAAVFVLLLRGVASPPGSEPTAQAAPDRPGLPGLMASVSARLELLPGQSEAERLRAMRGVVDLLRAGLAPHVEAEPLEGFGGEAAVLAVEHRILRRWLDELEELSTAPLPDAAAFARRAQRLLGLLEAHLEVEARFRIEAVPSPGGPGLAAKTTR